MGKKKKELGKGVVREEVYREAYSIAIRYQYDKPIDDEIKIKLDIERLIDTGRAYKC